MSNGKNKGIIITDSSPMQEDTNDTEKNSVIIIPDSENVNNKTSLFSKQTNNIKPTLLDQNSDSTLYSCNNDSTDSSTMIDNSGSINLSSDLSFINTDSSLMEPIFVDSSPISKLPENSILNKVSDEALAAFLCRPNSYIVCGSCGNIWQRNTSKSSNGTYLRFSCRGTLS